MNQPGYGAKGFAGGKRPPALRSRCLVTDLEKLEMLPFRGGEGVGYIGEMTGDRSYDRRWARRFSGIIGTITRPK